MKLGIGSYAFAWAIGVPGQEPLSPMDAFTFLQAASELKAEGVQIADNLPLHEMDPDAVRQLMVLARDLNLFVEVGTRGLHVDRVREYLQLASSFQSPFLRLVVDEIGYEPEVSEIICMINESLPIARDLGVVLAIENHDRFRAKELVHIVENTDPAQVGICLDTANSLGAGEGIGEVMHELAAYTVNLHIKDIAIKRVSSNMGFAVTGCPAGKGVIDVPSLLNRLSQNKNFYSVTLEVWSDFKKSIEQSIDRERQWVNESMAYLQKVMAAHRK